MLMMEQFLPDSPQEDDFTSKFRETFPRYAQILAQYQSQFLDGHNEDRMYYDFNFSADGICLFAMDVTLNFSDIFVTVSENDLSEIMGPIPVTKFNFLVEIWPFIREQFAFPNCESFYDLEGHSIFVKGTRLDTNPMVTDAAVAIPFEA